MRIFIDTDVILDVLLNREPHASASAFVMDWAEGTPGAAAVSWHGLANIHYLSRDGAEAFIREVIEFVEVPETGTWDMRQALQLGFDDLEDAMQTSAAIKFGAQAIITRNTADYDRSPIKVLSPTEFRAALGGSDSS